MTAWSLLASRPEVWRLAMATGRIVESLPAWLLPSSVGAWRENHDPPTWRGGAFRGWLAARSTHGR